MIALVFFAATSMFAQDVTTSYETVEVADGVYAFVAPEPKSGVLNAQVLEATRKRGNLEPFRSQLAGDDRNRRAAFDDSFASSTIESAWKQAKGLETSESPYPKPSRSE
jgi:hypothetical protein